MRTFAKIRKNKKHLKYTYRVAVGYIIVLKVYI